MRMHCRKSRYLIALSADKILAERDLKALESHLAICPACQAYSARMQSALSELDADAQALARAAVRRTDFSRFRSRIRAEADARGRRHATAVESVIATADGTASARLPGISKAPVAATCLLVAVLVVAVALLRPPENAGPEPRFGHLAAFSAQQANNGRVYARVAVRNPVGRCWLRGSLRRGFAVRARFPPQLLG